MKRIFLFLVVLSTLTVEAQYFQNRYNYNYPANMLPNERWNSGIRTQLNFGNGGALKHYFWTSIGVSFSNSTSPAFYPTDRMRFSVNDKNGVTIANLGYDFMPVGATITLNSEGNSIAELNNLKGTGGYVAVGSVTDNAVTGAAIIPGGSDALIVSLSASGIPTAATHLDVSGASDVATCIRKSNIVPNTYYICGYSRFSPLRTDCFVARVVAASTGISVVWCFSYNFDPIAGPNGPLANCRAYNLCEDINGNIYVVGTYGKLSSTGLSTIDGLAFGLTSAGANMWQKIYDTGTNDEFHSVRFTSDLNLIVGGFTEVSNSTLVNPNMWLVKLNLVGVPFFSNILIANNNSLPLSFIPSRCYDLVERINVAGSPEYYLVGPALVSGGAIQLMYKTNNIGQGMSHYLYNPLLFDVGFGIDYANNAYDRAGIGIFSSITGPATNYINDSHILKAYFNGATCTNLCSPHSPLTLPAPVNFPGMPVTVFANSQTFPLVAQPFKYQRIQQCNQPGIACGSNVRLAGDEDENDEGIISDVGHLKIYPNPVSQQFTFSLSGLEGKVQLQIVNVLGQQVFNEFIDMNGEENYTIDVATLPKGFYKLILLNGEILSTGSFIKE